MSLNTTFAPAVNAAKATEEPILPAAPVIRTVLAMSFMPSVQVLN